MLERGIKPFLTLNHWDLPQALQATGGWTNRETVQRFVDYAVKIHQRLGDRVEAIVTHNEPWVVATLGYETGIFAPGIKERQAAAQASHHLLLSHGMALRAMRDDGCKTKLGIVLNLAPMYPATDSTADQEKTQLEDGRLLRWFLGVNYYSRSVISADAPWDAKKSGLELTEMGWEIFPEGLTALLLRLQRDYSVPPLYITENGGAFNDQIKNGEIHDQQRTRFIIEHIDAVAQAMHQGVQMAGYMVWSLMDNFEWSSGYAKRFGIVHVDYETQTRTLKDSALWYREFLQRQKELKSHSQLTK